MMRQTFVRVVSALASAVFVLLAAPACAQSSDPEARIDWALDTAAGESFRLSEHVGEKTYLVLFWATWCPYCKALMPHIESMVLENADKDFEVLAVTIREDGDPAAVLAKNGFDFTLLPDGDAVAALYGIRGTPGVLIVDKSGEVVFDLREQPTHSFDTSDMKRSAIAARRAPLWAAQIRRALAAQW